MRSVALCTLHSWLQARYHGGEGGNRQAHAESTHTGSDVHYVQHGSIGDFVVRTREVGFPVHDQTATECTLSSP